MRGRFSAAGADCDERRTSAVAAANTLATQVAGLLLVRFRDLQIVVHAEDSRRHVGLHARDGGIARIVDDAFQRDVSILDDDVNGVVANGRIIGDTKGSPDRTAKPWSAIRSVTLQVWERGRFGVDAGADTIVAWRKRQNFDLILNRW